MTEDNIAAVEFADNQVRTPTVLLIDTSASVGPYLEELNSGLQRFEHELKSDPIARARVEVAIVTFGKDGVKVLQDFTIADEFTAPTLDAEGNTPFGAGAITTLDLVENRKRTYRQNGVEYTCPNIFCKTDGAPTDDWHPAAERIHREEAQRKIAFFAIGFGQVNMTTLAQIAPPNRPPLLLSGAKFRELFAWISKSQRIVSRQSVGTQVSLPPVNGWAVTQA